ncbi:MAG TPA: hypothetical protein VME69_06805 [Methylocella sp.]|nr:hypothetical protein [Methylocella sp.]
MSLRDFLSLERFRSSDKRASSVPQQHENVGRNKRRQQKADQLQRRREFIDPTAKIGKVLQSIIQICLELFYILFEIRKGSFHASNVSPTPPFGKGPALTAGLPFGLCLGFDCRLRLPSKPLDHRFNSHRRQPSQAPAKSRSGKCQSLSRKSYKERSRFNWSGSKVLSNERSGISSGSNSGLALAENTEQGSQWQFTGQHPHQVLTPGL